MAKRYTYDIDRVTHGIDHYTVEFWDDEEPATDAAHAISLIENGEVDLDFHEDVEWGNFEVVDFYIEDDDEEVPIDGA